MSSVLAEHVTGGETVSTVVSDSPSGVAGTEGTVLPPLLCSASVVSPSTEVSESELDVSGGVISPVAEPMVGVDGIDAGLSSGDPAPQAIRVTLNVLTRGRRKLIM